MITASSTSVKSWAVSSLKSWGSSIFFPELAVLRYDEHSHNNLIVDPDRESIVEPEFGNHYEIMIEVEMGKNSQFELRIGRSKDGQHFIPVVYNNKTKRLKFADKEADFQLNPGETKLSIRLFVDGNVGEAYINERACFSNVLSLSNTSTGVSLITSGGKAQIKRFSLWKMNSIWPNKDILTQ